MHYCTYYSMPKDTTEAEATPSGKKNQACSPGLCFPGSIISVNQPVSQ